MAVDPPQDTLFSTEARHGNASYQYFICQSGEQLSERRYAGGWKAPLPVGVAKEGTKGCYLIQGDDRRAIYCQGEDDILKDYEFDFDDWEWNEGELAALGVQAAPDTGLAVIDNSDEGTIEIAFQNVSGLLQTVRGGEGKSWQLSASLQQTNPLPGASIAAIVADDGPHIFYAHNDCSVHELTLSGNTWNDTIIRATAGESPRCMIHAFHTAEGGYFLQFCDEDRTLFALSDDHSTTVRVGVFSENGFKLDKDGQNTRPGTRAHTKIQYRPPPRRPPPPRRYR